MSSEWKERYNELPEALKEHIVKQFGISVGICIISVGIILYTRTWILCVPGLIIILFVIVNSLYLLYNCIQDRYIAVKGRCVEVEQTGAKNRVNSLHIRVEEGMLAVHIPYKLNSLKTDDLITVYLPTKAPVYERNGEYCIYRFYALEISRKV